MFIFSILFYWGLVMDKKCALSVFYFVHVYPFYIICFGLVIDKKCALSMKEKKKSLCYLTGFGIGQFYIILLGLV